MSKTFLVVIHKRLKIENPDITVTIYSPPYENDTYII